MAPGMNPIALELSLEQTNLILAALMELPFKLVYELIGSLHAQAASAFVAGTASGPQVLTFSRRQMRLIIEALAELPYRQVQVLLPYLHRQLKSASAGQVPAAAIPDGVAHGH